MPRTWQAKFEKHNRPEILEMVKELTDSQHVQVVPAVLIWLGCWSGTTAASLKRLGLTRADLEVMCVKVSTFTGNMVTNWTRSGWPGRYRRNPRVPSEPGRLG